MKRFDGSVANSSLNLIVLSTSVGKTSSSFGPFVDVVVAPVRVVAFAPTALLCRVISVASRLVDLTVSEKYRVSTSVVRFRPNRTSSGLMVSFVKSAGAIASMSVMGVTGFPLTSSIAFSPSTR